MGRLPLSREAPDPSIHYALEQWGFIYDSYDHHCVYLRDLNWVLAILSGGFQGSGDLWLASWGPIVPKKTLRTECSVASKTGNQSWDL